MNLKQQIEQLLQTIVPGATLSVSDKADFQCNVAFSLAKQQKTTPVAIATQIANQWNQQHQDLATATVANGFINLMISDQRLQEMATEIIQKQCLPLPEQPQRTVFFDYGGANIAKELHIGHLRPAIIGEAIKRVYQAFGHRTIAGAYLGDWGLPLGLIIASIIDQNLDIDQVTLEMLGEIYPAASKRKATDTAFYQRALDITAQFHNQVEPYYTMWQKLRNLSLPAIKKLYQQLNCTFDLYDGESTYQFNVDNVLQKLQDAGLLRTSDGALIVDVATPEDQKPMPPLVLRKQNGDILYATSDVSALYTRVQQYHPDQIIYFTDARQTLHFEQVFRTARLGNLVPDTTILTHIPFGNMCGKDGKPFKTRAGGNVKLDDILQTVTQATTQTEIAIAAVKFADLSNTVNKNYVFDIDKFMSFEGKTGPYLLYSIVRINAIFNKAGTFTTNFANLSTYLTPAIRDIFIKIIKLTESYSVALKTLSLNALTDALYNLANSFATFYTQQNIINESDTAKKELLLSVALLTKTALEFGLHTLAIDPVAKM